MQCRASQGPRLGALGRGPPERGALDRRPPPGRVPWAFTLHPDGVPWAVALLLDRVLKFDFGGRLFYTFPLKV